MADPASFTEIDQAIDLLEAQARNLLGNALRIPSVSGSEGAFTRFIADHLLDAGLDIDLWEIDESLLRNYPVSSAKHLPLAGRPTLLAKLKGTGGGKSLIFNAHADVVAAPHPERWTSDPWSGVQRDGRFFGRGACDVKGPLVSAIWALLAVKQVFPAGLAGDLLLELVPGEEDCVTLGTLTSVVRGHTADACIVLEPTESLPRNASRPGCRFEISCAGRSVHGTVKWLGVDAINVARAVLDSLEAIEKNWNQLPSDPYFYEYPIARPITVDTVVGGEWQGMICDDCRVAGYLELFPGDEPESWLRRLNTELQASLKSLGFNEAAATMTCVEAYAGHRLDSSSSLCLSANRAIDSVPPASENAPASWTGWAGFNSGCEAGLRAGLLGTPTLVWGPGSLAQAHAVDEFVDFTEVRTVARMFTRLIADWSI